MHSTAGTHTFVGPRLQLVWWRVWVTWLVRVVTLVTWLVR